MASSTITGVRAQASHDQLGRLAYSVKEAALVTGIGRTTLYNLMDEGRLQYSKINKRRLIRSVDLANLIDASGRPAA